MRKSFTLLLLLGTVGVGVYTFAKDKNNTSTSVSRGLTIDCSFLLKEYDRIDGELNQIESRFKEFKSLNETDHSISFLNRSAAWCKTVLYSLDNHLRHLNGLYEHCTCEAGKIEIPAELKILLEKIQKKHFLLRNRILALKTMTSSFQSKMQSGLN